MLFATLSTSWLLGWWTSIPSSFRITVRHPIIPSLRELGINLTWKFLLEPRLVLNLKPTLWGTTIKRSCVLHLLSMKHETRNVKILCSIAKWHSSCKSSDSPITKWFILSIRSETKEGAYFYNWVNFKEYSNTFIHPWRRLMKSTTLCSLFSLGKNLSRKAFLKCLYCSS